MSLPEPYWQDERRGLRLFHGDCRELLPLFADGEFGSVITDPPYGVGIAEWDVPPDSAILRECLRVTAGTIVMFGGAPTRSMIVFFGLEPSPERTLIWAPRFTAARTAAHGMFYQWHPIFLWRPPAFQNTFVGDVLNCSTAMTRTWFRHPATKPLSLIGDLCLAFGGSSVLDPYCGSGTTLAACAKLGLPCTGIEIEERYAEMTAKRLSEDVTYGDNNLFNQPALAEASA
jgi:DNA modification methylase